MRTLLSPLAAAYGAGVALRNLAFDMGLLKVRRLPVPVIAVGNLMAGGTGKTPLVEWIVRILQGSGRTVAVVSRGYGRRSSGVLVISDGASRRVGADRGGDEPVQIARKFPAARVVVGERRVDAGRIASGELSADVIVLDDAYQHRYVHRDLNLLVLRSGENMRDTRMLPAGERREPLRAMSRADLIVFSGLPNEGAARSQREALTHWYTGRVAGFRYDLGGYIRAGGDAVAPPGSFSRTKAFLFSGIGNHDGFRRSVADAGIRITGEMRFRDHHWYRPRDIETILEKYTRGGADILLTTEKDAVRMTADPVLQTNFLEPFPVWFPELIVTMVYGEDDLRSAVIGSLALK